MLTIEILPIALLDLQDIALYGLENHGIAQAERYQTELQHQFGVLADFPRMGMIIRHPTREMYRFDFGSHTIVYNFTVERIFIRRILGSRLDILRHL